MRWLSYCRANAGGKSFVMLVYPRKVLQNRFLHNEGTRMQDKPVRSAGRHLRVAASFNCAFERTLRLRLRASQGGVRAHATDG